MRDCHFSNDKDVIEIDGKTLRHSYDKSRRKGAIHVISAFSTMHSLVLGQIKTDEKSNEITAIPELLNMLEIKGKIITTDVMGCQKDIAEKKSVFILFAMSLMNLLILRLNGKD